MAASCNPQRGVTDLLLRYLYFLGCGILPGSSGVTRLLTPDHYAKHWNCMYNACEYMSQ